MPEALWNIGHVQVLENLFTRPGDRLHLGAVVAGQYNYRVRILVVEVLEDLSQVVVRVQHHRLLALGARELQQVPTICEGLVLNKIVVAEELLVRLDGAQHCIVVAKN